MATCPECDYDEIDTDDFEEGDTLSCPECGKNLIMIGADEVDFADEDEDDDDDEEEKDDKDDKEEKEDEDDDEEDDDDEEEVDE